MINADPGPLLTSQVHNLLLAARADGTSAIECSLDLGRTMATVLVQPTVWLWNQRRFPFLEICRERTIYHWAASAFEPVARYSSSLIKLVPTPWGPPTLEIDGIKMLPTARISPYEDAERKVALIQPRGKTILDTCGGLGYFAAWCLHGEARLVCSYEKNPDVIWLRGLNPWSPDSPWSDPATGALRLVQGDIVAQIATLPGASFDAILHDPPRFSIAGELYSQLFYDQLARVLRRHGKLFHYTGSPNKVSRGRNLANEVVPRLRRAGFMPRLHGDGLVAVKTGNQRRL